jgi:hypothetical protein
MASNQFANIDNSKIARIIRFKGGIPEEVTSEEIAMFPVRIQRGTISENEIHKQEQMKGPEHMPGEMNQQRSGVVSETTYDASGRGSGSGGPLTGGGLMNYDNSGMTPVTSMSSPGGGGMYRQGGGIYPQQYHNIGAPSPIANLPNGEMDLTGGGGGGWSSDGAGRYFTKPPVTNSSVYASVAGIGQQFGGMELGGMADNSIIGSNYGRTAIQPPKPHFMNPGAGLQRLQSSSIGGVANSPHYSKIGHMDQQQSQYGTPQQGAVGASVSSLVYTDSQTSGSGSGGVAQDYQKYQQNPHHQRDESEEETDDISYDQQQICEIGGGGGDIYNTSSNRTQQQQHQRYPDQSKKMYLSVTTALMWTTTKTKIDSGVFGGYGRGINRANLQSLISMSMSQNPQTKDEKLFVITRNAAARMFAGVSYGDSKMATGANGNRSPFSLLTHTNGGGGKNRSGGSNGTGSRQGSDSYQQTKGQGYSANSSILTSLFGESVFKGGAGGGGVDYDQHQTRGVSTSSSRGGVSGNHDSRNTRDHGKNGDDDGYDNERQVTINGGTVDPIFDFTASNTLTPESLSISRQLHHNERIQVVAMRIHSYKNPFSVPLCLRHPQDYMNTMWFGEDACTFFLEPDTSKSFSGDGFVISLAHTIDVAQILIDCRIDQSDIVLRGETNALVPVNSMYSLLFERMFPGRPKNLDQTQGYLILPNSDLGEIEKFIAVEMRRKSKALSFTAIGFELFVPSVYQPISARKERMSPSNGLVADDGDSPYTVMLSVTFDYL